MGDRLIFLLIAVICAVICWNIGIKYGMKSVLYFWLGFFLGIVGIIVTYIIIAEKCKALETSESRQNNKETIEEDVKFCSVCGNQLFPEDVICPNCQTVIDKAVKSECSDIVENERPKQI